jgi:hypothetical protein
LKEVLAKCILLKSAEAMSARSLPTYSPEISSAVDQREQLDGTYGSAAAPLLVFDYLASMGGATMSFMVDCATSKSVAAAVAAAVAALQGDTGDAGDDNDDMSDSISSTATTGENDGATSSCPSPISSYSLTAAVLSAVPAVAALQNAADGDNDNDDAAVSSSIKATENDFKSPSTLPPSYSSAMTAMGATAAEVKKALATADTELKIDTDYIDYTGKSGANTCTFLLLVKITLTPPLSLSPCLLPHFQSQRLS